MGPQLFCMIVIIHTSVLVTEILMYSYRFKVYPVDYCPMNKTEFGKAAGRRNCTGNSRYLCAPDKYLTSLIEFCTDQKKSLYEKDNCLKLEGTGYLNHYKCVDKFISGCPTAAYTDEEIYKYPACLSINRQVRCFLADKNCPEKHSATTKANDNGTSKDHGGNEINQAGSDTTSFKVATIVLVLVVLLLVLFGIIIIFYIARKRRRAKKKLVDGKKKEEEIEINNLPLNERTLESKAPLTDNNTNASVKQTEINEQKLREFLSKGKLTVRHVRCIIVGCAGAGKTTLLRRLKNLTFEEIKSRESTEIVDVHVNCFEVLEDEETIQNVDKKNKLPTIPLSLTAVENPPEKFEKREQNHNSEDSKNNTENCKAEQELNNFMECTDETGNDGNDCFERDDEKEVFETLETKQKVAFQGKQLTFPERDENDNSDNEDTTEDTALLLLPKCKMEIAEEGKNEKSRTLLSNSSGKALAKSKSNSCSSLYTQEETQGKSESNDFIRFDDAHDDDERYAISKIMDDIKKLPSENLIRPRITFLDFAGQSLYYAFHQIYLSPKTLYILVVDMTKNRNEEVLESDVDEIECSRFKSWKYQDYHKFWLQSIHSYSEPTTPVILVGTHGDNMSKPECRKFFQEFFDIFEEDYLYLRRHLHHDRTFAIGFPKTGSELENLSDIKKCLAKLVRDSKSFEEQIRPVWAIFEHILERMKTQRIISRKELSEKNVHLSEEFRMNDEEVTKMLCYLHRVGTVLYFDEEGLNETIVLDIQWFVNAFKSLIHFTVDLDDSDYSRDSIKSTGVIEDKKLTEIWKNKAKEEYILHKEKILPYMERLGLLVMQHENKPWYYIPSMNKRKFKNTDIDMGGPKSSILCFQFDENKQLPVFLFYGIVLKCMQIPKWSILQENEKICLYENAACFKLLDHIVVVCLCKHQIQVQVLVPAKGKIDENILKEVEQSIENKIQEYKEYKYTIGYKCQNGMLNTENDNSFVAKTEFPVSIHICDRCIVSKKHYVDTKICWIPTGKSKNEDTNYTSEINEETDEGLVSIKQMEQACLDGNIQHFNFHLENEIGPRHHLLMKSDKNGWSVLHLAAKGGNLTIFCKLVSVNLKICEKTHSQMTVLHIASKFGHYDICNFILKNNDFKKYVCEKSSEGKNACHYAAESGSVRLLRLLVDNGIDANAVTEKELNIFHIACIYNRLEMGKFIFDHFNDLVAVKSNDDWTAALYAAKNGNTEFLKFLFDNGVGLDHKSESNRNALHIACDNGHLESCIFLTDKCPPLLSAPDEKGRYPVHFAARSGNMELLKYLESKTELTKETSTGMNILHMACLHDHIEMCEYILDRYPSLNVKRTENGWTTAHYVAGRGNNKGNEIEIFKMLTNDKNRVEIKHLSKHGNSVLTLAIKYNVFEFAEYLFKNHLAMLNIPDANNPWETGNEHPKMLELLDKYLDKPL